MSAVWGPAPEFIQFTAMIEPEGRTLDVIVTGWEPSEQEPALVTVTLMLRLGPNVSNPVSTGPQR